MEAKITFKKVKNELRAFLPNGKQDIVIQFWAGTKESEIEAAKKEYLARYNN